MRARGYRRNAKPAPEFTGYKYVVRLFQPDRPPDWVQYEDWEWAPWAPTGAMNLAAAHMDDALRLVEDAKDMLWGMPEARVQILKAQLHSYGLDHNQVIGWEVVATWTWVVEGEDVGWVRTLGSEE